MAALEKKLWCGGNQSPEQLREALGLLFKKYDFTPAEELCKMVMGAEGSPVLSTSERIRILEGLQSYVMPKLKSTEVKGKVEHDHAHRGVVILRIGEDGTSRREALPAPKKVVFAQDVIDVEAEKGDEGRKSA